MEKLKTFFLKNNTIKQTVAKNTFWLFFGEALGRLVKLTVVLFATRVLGTDGWGTFSYALAFVSLFYVFGDIGINTFITKELSQNKRDRDHYLPSALILKLCLLVLSLAVSLVLIPHIDNNTLTVQIILVLAILNFSDAIREFLLSINRATERMEREALIKFIVNIGTTILGITLLLIQPSPLSLALGYALGSIIGTLVTLYFVPYIKSISWKINTKDIRDIAAYSWPFVATTIFAVAIANIDTIMLGQWHTASEVGLYAAAERIVQFLAVIPSFVGIATFPLVAKTIDDVGTAGRILEKILIMMIAIGLPVSVGGYLLRASLMTTLFGSAYIAGGVVLGILMISLFADFPNLILSNTIFAKNLQKKFVIVTAIGVVINIGLNTVLIPHYAALGAAISTSASQMLIMIMNWLLLKRHVPFKPLNRIANILLATAVMIAMMVLCTSAGVYFGLTILIAIMSYGGMLYLLKEPVLQEILTTIGITLQ